MATVQTSVIPEKYRSTRFKADCWYHLSNYYNKHGTWMAYKDYQKIGDKSCKENVFDQVRDEMRLDVVFNRPEACKGPADKNEAPVVHKTAPAAEVKPTAIASALVNGLANNAKESAKERSRGPVTVMRRQEAESWIRAHLDSGYAPFKMEFQEPELDKAWWDKVRNGLLHPPQQESSVSITYDSIKFDPRMHEDTRRVVKYFLTLSAEKINDLTTAAYTEKTRHKVPDPLFQSARRFVRKLMDNPAGGRTRATTTTAPKAAPVKERKARKQAPAGNSWITVAEIDLAAYSTCENKKLREFALELVKGLHPRGEEAKVVILAEPPMMEVRVPG